jgi:hypothetical protein
LRAAAERRARWLVRFADEQEQAMTGRDAGKADDKSAAERRKGLSDDQIKELELAGGVEGGMQAGSAGPSGKQKDGKSAGGPEDQGD